MEFTFAQVEQALAQHHMIASERRSAFANRIKHLQKQGFPPGTNTGRGRAASYQVQHLFLLGVALELAQFGYTPERSIRLISNNYLPLCEGVVDVVQFFNDFTIFLNFPANALSELSLEGERNLAPMTAEQVTGAIESAGEQPGVNYRNGFFSLTGLITSLGQICADPSECDALGDFIFGLRDWAVSIIRSANGHP